MHPGYCARGLESEVSPISFKVLSATPTSLGITTGSLSRVRRVCSSSLRVRVLQLRKTAVELHQTSDENNENKTTTWTSIKQQLPSYCQTTPSLLQNNSLLTTKQLPLYYKTTPLLLPTHFSHKFSMYIYLCICT